jgi:hypothetical protein
VDDVLRSLLEFLGLLALVIGGVAALYPLIGWISLAPAGAVLIGISWLLGRLGRTNDEQGR